MLHTLLGHIIACTFKTALGKGKPGQAMVVQFSVPVGEEFEGYANWTLLLWAPNNYLQVWVRKEWERLPIEGLDENEDILPGFGYEKGATDWKKLSDHDSGWRCAVDDFLWQHRSELGTFSGGFDEWYKLVQVSEEAQDNFAAWLAGQSPRCRW